MIIQSPFPNVQVPTNMGVTEYVFSKLSPSVIDNGEKVALIDGQSGQTFTYKQLQQLIFCVGKNLHDKFQFRKGHVFAIMLPNTPVYAALLHGVSSIGGICTTINPTYTTTELVHQLRDSAARFVVTIDMFLPQLQKALSKSELSVEGIFLIPLPTTPREKIVEMFKTATTKMYPLTELLAPPADKTPIRVEIDAKKDIAFLPYSSGTTGLSKGVMLTHHNVMMNLAQIESVYTMNSKEVMLGVLPMFHIYGLIMVLNTALKAGATVVTMAKFEFQLFLELIQKHKISMAPLVPPIILALAKHPMVAKYDLSSLREIISGAAPLPPTLAVEAVARLKHTIVRNGYGMTESSPVLTLAPRTSVDYASVGQLLPNTELKVVCLETGRELGEGAEGELCFRGPQVMVGYLHNQEATKFTIRDEWLHTGDIGYHKNGLVYVTDRLKELIKVKGFQVPPAELEAIILKHPSVADAAVIGVSHPKSGEAPKAFVVLKPNVQISSDELIHFASQGVAHYKKLHAVEFIDEVPKSVAGKVLRRVLKERESKASQIQSKL